MLELDYNPCKPKVENVFEAILTRIQHPPGMTPLQLSRHVAYRMMVKPGAFFTHFVFHSNRLNLDTSFFDTARRFVSIDNAVFGQMEILLICVALGINVAIITADERGVIMLSDNELLVDTDLFLLEGHAQLKSRDHLFEATEYGVTSVTRGAHYTPCYENSLDDRIVVSHSQGEMMKMLTEQAHTLKVCVLYFFFTTIKNYFHLLNRLENSKKNNNNNCVSIFHI